MKLDNTVSDVVNLFPSSDTLRPPKGTSYIKFPAHTVTHRYVWRGEGTRTLDRHRLNTYRSSN